MERACLCVTMVMLFGEVAGLYELTILHTNDVHARFEGANMFGGRCVEPGCYGGAARRATTIKEIRAQRLNVLLLDAGDQFQGTFWFTIHQGNATAAVMPTLGYDAMALGNHEFDSGLDVLSEFLSKVTTHFPVVCANLDVSREPRLSSVKKYDIVTVGAKDVALIGYLTADTPFISYPGLTDTLTFNDEVESVTAAVNEIRTNHPLVNIIIAVGHAGFEVDKRIAAIDGIDVAVGGHTNTFLYTGTPPSEDVPQGVYPTVVDQPGGGRGLVVQDFFFGKYLGDLQLQFDDEGAVQSYEGSNPILMGPTVSRDSEMEALMQPYKDAVDTSRGEVIGTSSVMLNGEVIVCRQMECNLGSLITDAMIYQAVRLAEEGQWTKAAIAITNSGGIRSSITAGDITNEDVSTVMPFRNTLDIIFVKGSTLWEMFEHSVSALALGDTDLSGQFLQVSGAQVTYDISKEPGSRVVSLYTRCWNCTSPVLEEINMDGEYPIILPQFLSIGGDKYTMIPPNIIIHENLGILDADMLSAYIRDRSPIYASTEGRIIFRDVAKECDAAGFVLEGSSSAERFFPMLTITLLATIVLQSV